MSMGRLRGKAAGLAALALCAALVAAISFRGLRHYFSLQRNPIPEIAEAEGLLEAGNVEGAAEAYSRAMPAHPNNGLLYFYRGKAFLSAGRIKDAADDFTKSINMGYPETSSYLWRAVIKGRYQGDWAGQAADSSRVLRTDTTSMEAYFLRAEARIKLGDYGGAMTDYKSAIALEPKDASLYAERAGLELLTGDYSSAEKDARAALKINPSLAPAHAALGAVHFRTGAISEAERDYSLAITNNGKNADYYAGRAAVREAGGDFGGAVSDYESAVQISSSSAQVCYLLARACFRMNEQRKALAAADRAISIAAGAAAYHGLRARIHSELRDYDAAVKDWETAARLDPSSAEAAWGQIRRIKRENRKK